MIRFLAFVATFILLGAGCVFGEPEKPIPETPKSTTSDPVIEEEPIEEEDTSEPDPVTLDALPATSDLCLDDPVAADAGTKRYPVDPIYGDLLFLGELFTAARCGDGRVNDLPGIEGETYTLGSTIILNSSPDKTLKKTLRWIGFVCDEDTSDSNCTRWELVDEVPYKHLLYLEPFHDSIMVDDCRNCG